MALFAGVSPRARRRQLMRAELEFHRIVVSNVAAERAEDVGKWRIGLAGLPVVRRLV